MQLFIIDAIGPFFRDYRKKTINWSKIPFSHLEDDDGLDMTKIKKMSKEFNKFIDRVTDLGYNAISIDDLAHLVIFDFYDDETKKLITDYQLEFGKLFDYARSKRLQIFINTDVMFYNRQIEFYTRNRLSKITDLLSNALHELFENFPVDGVIFRIGESDGVDVNNQFKSRMVLKTPKQANAMIKKLLPIFEKFDRTMIFRTWTVGMYPIGDLIWNEKTFSRLIAGVDSKHFIISLKFRDTDFYDDLELNRLFRIGSTQKIIELQTRREREGFGELPYYVGWQYEKYFNQLSTLDTLVGVSVWCQSGGWSTWFNRTYLKESSVWNELNTQAVIDIYKNGLTADESLAAFFRKKAMVDFVRHAHQLIHHILYIEPFSENALYFRRLRIPPLIWLFWDHVVLNPLMLAFMDYVGAQKFKMPKKELEDFYAMGKKLGIANIEYMHDTLLILARCRRALWKKSIKSKHLERIHSYQQKYDIPLKFSIHLSSTNYSKARLFFAIFVRRGASYRFIDKLLLSPIISATFRLAYRLMRRNLPAFANKQAMQVDTLFK